MPGLAVGVLQQWPVYKKDPTLLAGFAIPSLLPAVLVPLVPVISTVSPIFGLVIPFVKTVPSGCVTRTSIREMYMRPFPPSKCVMMVVEYIPDFSTENESGH